MRGASVVFYPSIIKHAFCSKLCTVPRIVFAPYGLRLVERYIPFVFKVKIDRLPIPACPDIGQLQTSYKLTTRTQKIQHPSSRVRHFEGQALHLYAVHASAPYLERHWRQMREGDALFRHFAGAEVAEHLAELAAGRLAHEPRRQVGRVPVDRVLRPAARADAGAQQLPGCDARTAPLTRFLCTQRFRASRIS